MGAVGAEAAPSLPRNLILLPGGSHFLGWMEAEW